MILRHPALALASGFVGAALLLAAVVALTRPVQAPADSWRPSCVNALSPALQNLDILIKTATRPPPVAILGIDRSGSNREAYDHQVVQALQWLKSLPATTHVAVLQIDGQSDHSGVRDFFWHARPTLEIHAPNLCSPSCSTSSLFEQTCTRSLDLALKDRVRDSQQNEEKAAAEHLQARDRALSDFFVLVNHDAPAQQTSILGFWRKLADLPQVRAAGSQVNVVILSDLVDTQTHVRRFLNAHRKATPCPASSIVPQLGPINIVLLQNRNDPKLVAVGEAWQQSLICAGAQVKLSRWTNALGIGDYLTHVSSHAGSITAAHATRPTAK